MAAARMVRRTGTQPGRFHRRRRDGVPHQPRVSLSLRHVRFVEVHHKGTHAARWRFAQIEQAVAQLPPAQTIKLYNAGNFFDAQAIPTADLPRTSPSRWTLFATVVVECHPLLVGQRCALRFATNLPANCRWPWGWRPSTPTCCRASTSAMTLADFSRTVDFLSARNVPVRALSFSAAAAGRRRGSGMGQPLRRVGVFHRRALGPKQRKERNEYSI